jgi:prepilin-type N-terminal cleavage/methylation domain-containing protein
MKKIKFTSATKGFTLIELLVVIAIIGILGAIVYAPFQTARRKGRDGQRIVEMKNLQTTLYLYSDAHGGLFPKDIAELKAASTDNLPANVSSSTSEDLTKYNYTAYKNADGQVVGFHIWTHLETANPALSGAAKCKGINTSTSFDSSKCITIGTGGAHTDTSVDDSNVTAKFLDHTGDTDQNCVSDMTSCIFDLKS